MNKSIVDTYTGFEIYGKTILKIFVLNIVFKKTNTIILCCKFQNHRAFKVKPKSVPSHMNTKIFIEYDDIHMSYYHAFSSIQNIFINAVSGLYLAYW